MPFLQIRLPPAHWQVLRCPTNTRPLPDREKHQALNSLRITGAGGGGPGRRMAGLPGEGKT